MEAPQDEFMEWFHWWHSGHLGWIILFWFREEAHQFFKREVISMWAWLKKFLIGKFEEEAETEIASLIRQAQAKTQTINADELAKNIVEYVNLKLGIQGGTNA